MTLPGKKERGGKRERESEWKGRRMKFAKRQRDEKRKGEFLKHFREKYSGPPWATTSLPLPYNNHFSLLLSVLAAGGPLVFNDVHTKSSVNFEFLIFFNCEGCSIQEIYSTSFLYASTLLKKASWPWRKTFHVFKKSLVHSKTQTNLTSTKHSSCACRNHWIDASTSAWINLQQLRM